nr:hypothetical protein [Haliscomenobacter sp.]
MGRIRIQQELKQRKVSDAIRKGMEEIEEEEYLKTLQSHCQKTGGMAGEEEFAARQKTAPIRHAQGVRIRTHLGYTQNRIMQDLYTILEASVAEYNRPGVCRSGSISIPHQFSKKTGP